MKPYLLRLQAFGPFSTRQEICFDEVYKGGLFLIHGRTGAGKTSLLDGLCFSLFGRPSTQEREKDLRALRSDLAPAELLTETELIFSLGNEIFKVHRIPSQHVPKKRGEGTTELKATAELWRLHVSWPNLKTERLEIIDSANNWTPVAAKQDAVDREIEALLGMNERQFRQVVILPQGKFREFLSSTSAERQTILERLFQTDRFSRFQAFLTQHHKNLEAKWKTRTDLIESRLKGAEIESIQAIPEEVQKRLLLAKELSENGETLRKQQNEQSVLVHRLENLEQSRKRLDEVKKEILNLEKDSASIQKMKEQVQAYDRLVKYVALRERLEAVAKRLSQSQAQNHSLKGQLVEVEKATSLKQEQQDALLRTTPSLDSLNSEYQRLRELYPAVKAIASELEAKDQESRTLTRASSETESKMQHAKGVIANGSLQHRALRKTHELLLHKENQSIEAQAIDLKALEMRYHQSQAAALAAELKAHQPCPVCGSKDHPSPAAANVHAVSKDELETARRKNLEILESKRLDQDRRISKLKQIEKYLEPNDVSEKSENADLDLGDISSDEFHSRSEILIKNLESARNLYREVASTKAAIEPRLLDLKTRTDELRHQLEKLEPTDRDLNQITRKGNELKAEIEKRSSLSESIKTELITLEKKQGELSALLKSNTNDIVAASEEHKLISSQINEELELAGFPKGPPADLIGLKDRNQFAQSVSNYEAALALTQGAHKEALDRFSQCEKELESSPRPHLEEAKASLRLLAESIGAVAAQSAKLEVEVANLRRLETEISLEEAELRKIREESDRTIRMTALVTGDRSQNKLSVPLSRFVLQSRFDDVLDQANRRLARMSRGRYLLRRPALSRNLAQSQGLNLSVEDSITGKERHADSLSGGESFMAALSLALGLADVVQSNLGGVRLDSVLIDEGFGTLDAESLDLALRTLIDLQAGGRMVGIISHVQELKSQIDRRLEVIPDREGSRIRWESETSVPKRDRAREVAPN